MEQEPARALLSALGYELRFRADVWVECLLLREGESWLGRGVSREAALEAALTAACPSALARRLLQDRLRVGSEDARSLLPVAAPAGEPSLTPPRASSPGPEDSGRPAPEPARPRPAGEPGRAASGGEEPAERAARPAPPRASPAPPLLVRKEDPLPPPRVDVARALEELEVLFERVRESREELGLCAPERQRLAILAWICEARGHTDSFPEDARVREKVGLVSRQLTEIGKCFWPGSVTALQLQMQPRDLPRHVLGGMATSWGRAAELAERALASLEYADERRGFDAYGWADSALGPPRPARPRERLDHVVGEMERHGPVVNGQPARPTDPPPAAEDYRRWVRELRWLRQAEVDPDRWARAMGRLRWWAAQRELGLAVMARELDPAHAPEQPWAMLLGVADTDLAERSGEEPAAEGLVRRMAGKRLVFVSMRRDPELQARLLGALPGVTVDWRVAEPRRLEAVGEAIAGGAYDVVLGAVGFQSPGVDHLLARACRAARVRYLRVNRGRPAACLRALARD